MRFRFYLGLRFHLCSEDGTVGLNRPFHLEHGVCGNDTRIPRTPKHRCIVAVNRDRPVWSVQREGTSRKSSGGNALDADVIFHFDALSKAVVPLIALNPRRGNSVRVRVQGPFYFNGGASNEVSRSHVRHARCRGCHHLNISDHETLPAGRRRGSARYLAVDLTLALAASAKVIG